MVSTPSRLKRWIPKVGDRVEYFGDLQGTLTEIDPNHSEPYLVSFDAGKNERFSKADFKKWVEFVDRPILPTVEISEQIVSTNVPTVEISEQIVSTNVPTVEISEQIVSTNVPTVEISEQIVSTNVPTVEISEQIVSTNVPTVEIGKLKQSEIPKDCQPKYKVGDRIVPQGQTKVDGYVKEVVNYGIQIRYEVTWSNGRNGSYEEKEFEFYAWEIQELLTEEQLTPTDESAIGKHYWFDQNTVAVTVLSCQYWKKNSKGKPVAIGRVRPWWTHEQGERIHPDQFAVEFSQLVEVEEFSCPVKFLETTESTQVGSLYQYTSNKADKKTGTIRTFPPVDGERQRENDAHWYWGFSYIEKHSGKRRDRSAAVPRDKLKQVREAIRDRKPYTWILQAILGKD